MPWGHHMFCISFSSVVPLGLPLWNTGGLNPLSLQSLLPQGVHREPEKGSWFSVGGMGSNLHLVHFFPVSIWKSCFDKIRAASQLSKVTYFHFVSQPLGLRRIFFKWCTVCVEKITANQKNKKQMKTRKESSSRWRWSSYEDTQR